MIFPPGAQLRYLLLRLYSDSHHIFVLLFKIIVQIIGLRLFFLF